MAINKTFSFLLGAALAVSLLFASPALAGANIMVNNVDAPGIGFNDPTPVAPVGGNPGTTLGEQRLIVFEFAADLWGSVLDSDVDIIVQATFQPLNCSPNSGTLGAAGAIQIFAFGAPAPAGAIDNTWYHVALANALAGVDLAPGPPDPGLLVPPFADDIVAFFNGAIGTDPNCLVGLDWYNGLDNNAGPNDIDLLNVVMHEIAHGLGFSEFVSESTGAFFFGLKDIYSTFMLDTTAGTTWPNLTDAGRLASQVNTGNLVWNGANVTAAAPTVLGNQAVVEILAPAGPAGTLLDAQPAAFGPAFPGGADDDSDSGSDSDSDSDSGAAGLTGEVVLADDGVGNGTDACQPIVNNVSGKIALIDRGACAFTTKVANAQAAGAIGAIIANNVAGGPAPMGGSDPSITIVSVGITLADGNLIKANLPGVVVSFGFDPTRFSGANAAGQVKLYAPNPVAPGSSKSHWDVSATPNLLMEPFINTTLRSSEDVDLTPFLFFDEGWQPCDDDDSDTDSDSDSGSD